MTLEHHEHGGVTFKIMYPPCYYYSCANCPYRGGPFCRYTTIKKEEDNE